MLTEIFTSELVIFSSPLLFRCFMCFSVGGGKKLNNIGMRIIEKTNNPMILIEARMPNSFRSVLLVVINVAKPQAVVKFARNIDVPVLEITLFNAFILLW